MHFWGEVDLRWHILWNADLGLVPLSYLCPLPPAPCGFSGGGEYISSSYYYLYFFLHCGIEGGGGEEDDDDGGGRADAPPPPRGAGGLFSSSSLSHFRLFVGTAGGKGGHSPGGGWSKIEIRI